MNVNKVSNTELFSNTRRFTPEKCVEITKQKQKQRRFNHGNI